MITIFSTSSYGWSPLILHKKKFLKKTHWLSPLFLHFLWMIATLATKNNSCKKKTLSGSPISPRTCSKVQWTPAFSPGHLSKSFPCCQLLLPDFRVRVLLLGYCTKILDRCHASPARFFSPPLDCSSGAVAHALEGCCCFHHFLVFFFFSFFLN